MPSFADHAVWVNCVIDFGASSACTGAASANGMMRHATRAWFLRLEGNLGLLTTTPWNCVLFTNRASAGQS
jgi:hypothetical protein